MLIIPSDVRYIQWPVILRGRVCGLMDEFAFLHLLRLITEREQDHYADYPERCSIHSVAINFARTRVWINGRTSLFTFITTYH